MTLPFADLGECGRFFFLGEPLHRPRAAAAAGGEEEGLQHLAALRGVNDFGVELQPEDRQLFVRSGGERGGGGLADRKEARRQLLDAIAVAHPHLERLALLEAGERAQALDHFDVGRAVLAVGALVDAAAEHLRHQLQAVADAEHRDPGVVDGGIDRRCTLDVHRRGTAAEDEPAGVGASISSAVDRVRHDLGETCALCTRWAISCEHVRAEVDDKDGWRSDNGNLVACRAHRWSDLPSVCSAGATITSAFWNSFTVSYPVVAIEVRSAPKRLSDLRSSCLGTEQDLVEGAHRVDRAREPEAAGVRAGMPNGSPCREPRGQRR